MIGWTGTTDLQWFRFLRAQPRVEEVNFWQPSARQPFKHVPIDAPFFFKLKAPHNAIVGFGFYKGYSRLPLWLAWETFREKNGAPSYARMCELIGRYRRMEPAEARSEEIGCLMIAQPVFFADSDWITQPTDWAPNIVQGKSYDLTKGEGARIWEACKARLLAQPLDTSPTRPYLAAEEGPRYGQPQWVKPRMGQAIFRVTVTDAYARACAITREHSLPALDAAHIVPFGDGGPHDVSNGVALRADIHRLFDRGYVTITPDYRFRVSPRLREEFDNGRVYYDLERSKPEIWLPPNPADRPRREFLEHHRDNVFRG